MSTSISRRRLTEKEITLLINDARIFPDIAYVSRTRWSRFAQPYIIEDNNVFVGVCAVYYFDKWIKLGPLEILKKFHGKGMGKRLLHRVVNDHNNHSIVLASSNPVVQHIAETLSFKNIPQFLSLPKIVQLFLLRQLIEHLNMSFFYEGIRKKFFLNRKNIKYYIKQL